MSEKTVPTLAGRMLAPTEVAHVEPMETVAYAVTVTGPLNASALSEAFAATCRAHPVFTGCLRSGPAGTELFLDGNRTVPPIRFRTGDGNPEPATRTLDHADELIGLEVSHGDRRSTVTLLTDHSIADASASVALLAELWGHYTDIVETGLPTPLGAFPVPESLEALLAHRGVTRLERNGLEALFEPFAVPDRPEDPAADAAAPTGERARSARGRIRFTAETTSALARVGRANGVSVHGLVSAAVMIAHAGVKAAADHVHEVAVPFIYPVDVRTRISPPVDAFGGTNVFGTVGFTRSLGVHTDPVVLAKDLLDELKASIEDGVVQQSQLHLTGPDQEQEQAQEQDVSTPAEAAAGTAYVLADDTVMLTNWGRIPELRTPAGCGIEDFRGAIIDQRFRPAGRATPWEPPAPTSTYVVTHFAGRLSVELATAHTSARAAEILSALERTVRELTA
ncbi:hypothetical protein ACE1OC_08050 [Streptomyces sp. DSM 116496]|uniref:phthiocerol/phthiodiolone dimycocerosyl transferase family protein n=1 Tax=Streptomyces stoeckheimensis TaxID=3344656 RepID=UPI0038B258F0